MERRPILAAGESISSGIPRFRDLACEFSRIAGRQRLMTLGRYGVITFDQARDLAREVLFRVSKSEDPLGEKQVLRKAENFGELWESFLNNYAKAKKKTWLEDERRFKRCIPPTWHAKRLVSITAKDLETLHFRIGQKSKIEANRTLALISKMFNYARMDNPTKGIEKFAEVKRDRWLTREELVKLREGITKEPNVYIQAGIFLLLLTGIR